MEGLERVPDDGMDDEDERELAARLLARRVGSVDVRDLLAPGMAGLTLAERLERLLERRNEDGGSES
jgi:hypothetical protein